jgi:hypothetical protein
LIKIPAPEFYVLYNGEKEYPLDSIQRLSDAFLEHSGALELKVRVININYRETSEVLAKSQTLKGYSYFINCAREYRSSGKSLEETIELTVRKCIDEGILREFFESHASEVVNMLFTEFKLDDALQVREQESWQSGFEKGEEIGVKIGEERGEKKGEKKTKYQIATSLLGIIDNILIAEKTGLTIKEVEGLRKPLS